MPASNRHHAEPATETGLTKTAWAVIVGLEVVE